MPRSVQSLLILGVLSLAASCSKRDERIDVSRTVSIYPGSPIVELPGATAPMKIVVRNVSEVKLTALRLEIKSDACTAQITPATIGEINPGDRKSFAAVLTRVQGKAPQRHPLALTLHGQGLPVPAGLDLMVDLSPPLEKGWIDVGQITLVSRKDTKTLYYVVAGAPIVVLLGYLLWRWSRPRRRPEAGAKDAGAKDAGPGEPPR